MRPHLNRAADPCDRCEGPARDPSRPFRDVGSIALTTDRVVGVIVSVCVSVCVQLCTYLVICLFKCVFACACVMSLSICMHIQAYRLLHRFSMAGYLYFQIFLLLVFVFCLVLRTRQNTYPTVLNDYLCNELFIIQQINQGKNEFSNILPRLTVVSPRADESCAISC